MICGGGKECWRFMVRCIQSRSVLGEAHEYWLSGHALSIGKRGAVAGARLFIILRKIIS